VNHSRIVALALTLAASPAAALNLATGGVGTSGADFLTIGVGARALAMGGAFTAVDTGADANAVNWNPSALALVDKPDVTMSYNSLFVDQNQGFLGFASPLGENRGTWAAGLNYMGITNIEKRTVDSEAPDSTFSNENYAFSGSYAKAFGDSVFVGGSLKYVHTSLDNQSENAVAVDAGALYRTGIENLTLGAAMRDLGTNIGPDSMPLDFRGGASYKMLGQKLTVASDVDWMEAERRAYWSFGGEFWVTPNLGIRGGYEFGHGVDQLNSTMVGLGVGLGVKFSRFTMDYAFLPFGDLGDTHRVTLGLRF
jgi:hypothetical protein